MGILILPWLKTKLSGHDNLQRRLLPLFEPVDAYLGGHRVNKLWYSSLRVLNVIFLILLQLFLYLRFVFWCKNSTSTRNALYLSYWSDYESYLNIIWEEKTLGLDQDEIEKILPSLSTLVLIYRTDLVILISVEFLITSGNFRSINLMTGKLEC